jgi:hypothetical protein
MHGSTRPPALPVTTTRARRRLRSGRTSRSTARGAISVAEPLCGASDWFDPPGMSGSRHHPQRAPLAPRAVGLFSIPSRHPNASLARQGVPTAPSRTTSLDRQHHCLPRGWRSAPSLRASSRLGESVHVPGRTCPTAITLVLSKDTGKNGPKRASDASN